MSYQVIARKWRPQAFDEVTGQEVITQTLRNALEHDRLHHAYLFSGARGVGKTTTARLLAKALNCHKASGPTVTICSGDQVDICPSCLEISESRSIDVLEIDAASHTGIDDVRETILESINFNPARDRYKVFIIDEVHMLSKSAFNALLKTLEEPPQNVVFVMATTELHKVPDTILSRCQEFQFRTIPLQKIFDRLKQIADAEAIDIAEDALREIARSGEGSMRDAQSNFDQVISFSGATITSVDVTNALGFASVEVLTRIVKAIAGRDSRDILAVVDDLVVRGHDMRNFCRDLLGLFRDMLVFKVAGDEPSLFESAVISAGELDSLTTGFTESDLLRVFNSLAETETRLKEATQSRYVLEIGLIRLIEMRRVEPVEKLLERLGAFENALAGGGVSVTEQPPRISPAAQAKVTAAVPDPPLEEKKTPDLALRDKRGDVRPHDDPPPERPFGSDLEFDPEPDETEFLAPIPAIQSPAVIQNIWMPPLSAEALEHYDHADLDDAFEIKMERSGDKLAPFENASGIVGSLFGIFEVPTSGTNSKVSNGNSAAATAPAFAVHDIMPAEEPEAVEIPILGDDPTEEELWAHANALPAVRAALKVFRGKIVKVELNSPAANRKYGTGRQG